MAHRQSLKFWLLAGIAAWSAVALAQSAPSPPAGGACFEVLPAGAMALPGAPLLINKCTGQTYVLTRVPVHRKSAGPYTYRWQPIAVSDTPEAAPKPATGAPTGHKCFSFDGRQFCP